ncbi:MAG: class I tRNA ligase family protein, partial [Patescibacteria group bacterium]
KKAKEEKTDWKELGDKWTNQFLSDLRDLNIVMPTHYVKATESIDTIIKMTENLIEKNYAYQKEGNVYFDITQFKTYGGLSHFNEVQMLALAQERGGNTDDLNKKHPLDFILWQKSFEGEPSWNSPWSAGRPGWHIECSAMINKHLGDQIDIHGGGKDLIYPHHESEIAQSEGVSGRKPFVKYWMHVAMLMYECEKMSKSLGNLVLVNDLLKTYSTGAIRWLLLSHHYRHPWEFYFSELDEVEEIMTKVKRKIREKDRGDISKVTSLLGDDMNTPDVLKLMQNSFSGQPLKQVFELLGFLT